MTSCDYLLFETFLQYNLSSVQLSVYLWVPTMISKNCNCNLFIVFLTVYSVYSQEGTPQPESNTNKRQILENHFITKSNNDSHIYYSTKTIINDDKEFNRYWVDLKTNIQADHYGPLLDFYQHTNAVKIHNFQFPFYGNLVNDITISNEGFLFLGGKNLYSWTARTQYIAPLMVDMNIRTTEKDTHVYVKENETSFIVSWLNIRLKDKPEYGSFSFQTILYSNGNIVFVYKNVPIKIKDIDSSKHQVKIGLSDAWIEDKLFEGVKQVIVTEYNRVMINQDDISNHTVIIFTPLSKCKERKNCTSCIKKDINLQCYWCDNQCYSVMDHHDGCEKINLNPEEDICASEIPNLLSTTVVNSSVKPFDESESHKNSSPRSSTLFFTLSILSALMILAWTIYAYLNPSSPSGQVLMTLGQNPWANRRSEDINVVDTTHI